MRSVRKASSRSRSSAVGMRPRSMVESRPESISSARATARRERPVACRSARYGGRVVVLTASCYAVRSGLVKSLSRSFPVPPPSLPPIALHGSPAHLPVAPRLVGMQVAAAGLAAQSGGRQAEKGGGLG